MHTCAAEKFSRRQGYERLQLVAICCTMHVHLSVVCFMTGEQFPAIARAYPGEAAGRNARERIVCFSRVSDFQFTSCATTSATRCYLYMYAANGISGSASSSVRLLRLAR